MSLLPWWVKALVLGGVLLIAVSLVRYYNESLREQGREEIRTEWFKAAQVAQDAEHRKALERRRKDKEAEDETAAALSRLAADAASSHAAAGRLQRRVAELAAAARCPVDPSGAAVATAPGQQGADPVGVLAIMLGRLDEAAQRVGEYADRLRIAGQGCESRFDSAVSAEQLSPAGAGPASPGAP